MRELFQVGMGMKVLKDNHGGFFWACSECGHIYCKIDENPKLKSKMIVGYLNEIAHPAAQTTRKENPRFFFRRFFCPNCGIAWNGELGRAEDPILSTIEYDKEWLKSL